MIFLSAEWNHLLLANYSVNPEVLQPYVPKGTSLDLFEGQAFVSLVAFMFNKTKILGVPVPGHINFEEVNLRFYIKPDYDPSIRAVCFIKEIVPKPMIPLVANSLFNEHYESLKMEHSINLPDISYSWYSKDKQDKHTFSATISEELSLPTNGSIEEFITEHYWGYSGNTRKTVEYRVKHPQWLCAKIKDYTIDVNFAESYGSEFAFMQELLPYNVQYARGSAVTVSTPKWL